MSTITFDQLDDGIDFEETSPGVSAWSPSPADFAAERRIWCIRCATRMVAIRHDLGFEQAHDVAFALSLDDFEGLRTPELVAEDFVRDRLFLE